MRFTFRYTNDFAETVNVCVRCGADTRERCLLSCPGIRLLVYACRGCLLDLAYFVWFFHELPLRAVFEAKEKSDEGQSLVEYENSFDWRSVNGVPPKKTGKK